MTTPKIPTTKRGGHRYYIHPETGDAVPGVTSVISMLPKPFLKFWAAKLVAETAVEQFGSLAAMMASGDHTGAVDWLKRAPTRKTTSAGDTGSAVHAVTELLSQGIDPGPLHPDIAPFIDGWKDFAAEWEPKFRWVEETVWSEKYGYAGSFDAIAEINGELAILDYKTTASGVYPEVALQLTAYARADYILHTDGTTTPMPEIASAAVIHLRPEGASLVPVFMSDEAMGAFLALRATIDWDRELHKHALGKPMRAKVRVS